MFLTWIGCPSFIWETGFPISAKLSEWPSASVSWILSKERLGVCLSLPWCSPTRWTGMCSSMALLAFRSPKCPLEDAARVPLKGNVSGYTCCDPSPCLWTTCFTSPSDNYVGDVFSRHPFILPGISLWHHGPRGPIELEFFTHASDTGPASGSPQSVH